MTTIIDESNDPTLIADKPILEGINKPERKDNYTVIFIVLICLIVAALIVKNILDKKTTTK